MLQTPSAFDLTLRDSELSSHNFTFGAHHGDMAAPMSPHIDSWSGLGYTDSLSSISFSISKTKILAVKSSADSKSLLSLTPQPASDYINIDIFPMYSTDAVFIFDLLGRMVMSNKILPMSSHMQVNVSSLPPGIYYLRAGNQMQKFVIQR